MKKPLGYVIWGLFYICSDIRVIQRYYLEYSIDMAHEHKKGVNPMLMTSIDSHLLRLAYL